MLCAGPLHSSQISLSCVVFAPASCSDVHARTHSHTHAVTDVTRIQEGVAAYYILTAHAGCLARLGLFKRLRLDKQRGLCLCSLLISSHLISSHLISSLSLCICHFWVFSVLNQSYNPPISPMQTLFHTQRKGPTAQLRLQPWHDATFDALILAPRPHKHSLTWVSVKLSKACITDCSGLDAWD